MDLQQQRPAVARQFGNRSRQIDILAQRMIVNVDDRGLRRSARLDQRHPQPRRQFARPARLSVVVIQSRHDADRVVQRVHVRQAIGPADGSASVKHDNAQGAVVRRPVRQASQVIGDHLRHAAAVQVVVDDRDQHGRRVSFVVIVRVTGESATPP